MSLRFHLEAQPETLQEMELAAEDKYWEGIELILAGRGGGGIYLLGYVAEMLLKVAYFRFTGAHPSELVERRLGPARNQGEHLIPGVPYERYHSLRFWALLLFRARREQRRPLSDQLAARFQQGTRRLHQRWWVEMRYRRDRSVPWDLHSVYEDVTWLRDHYAALWR